MVNYFLAFYFLGLGLSFTSSTILIVLLSRMNYKDHSTKLRIYLALIDIISSISLGIPFIPVPNPLYNCAYNSLYYFVIMFHGFWVFFISLSLYLIIVHKQETLNQFTSASFFVFALISLGASMLPLMLPYNDQDCFVLNNPNSMLIYLSITLISFEILILLLISFFYFRIRKTLKNEISKIDTKSHSNHLLCLRLLGYPILFFIFTMFSELILFQYLLKNHRKIIELYEIRIIVIVYYPLFNSLLYGYTKSSKKYLWYLLLKMPDYKESQEILNDIRGVGLIQDRVFLDLADISESEIFND